MSYFDRDTTLTVVGFVLIFIFMVGGAAAWHWYKAGLQSRAYARQGIVLSQWECFMGVEPAVRSINIKEMP
jgi:hypothetical protein